VEAPSGTPSVHRVEGDVIKKKISKTNDFRQEEEKYRSLSKMDQEHLVDNLIADLTPIDKPIQQRVTGNLTKADPALGKAVAAGLNL
jgi:catalase